jgi:putative phage-type endonuclease
MTATNPQDRDAWIKKRSGKITASRIGDIARRTKSGQPYATWKNYVHEVLTERLTERAMDHYVSPAMEWGMQQEEAAVAYYEFEQGVECAYSDFVDHPTIEGSGASPDRLVGDDGLLEVKNLAPHNHVEFLINGVIDGLGEKSKGYPWQMQWQMACTGRKWCDFVSFDSSLPLHLQGKIVRVDRDDEMIAEAEAAVKEALAYIAERERQLRELS